MQAAAGRLCRARKDMPKDKMDTLAVNSEKPSDLGLGCFCSSDEKKQFKKEVINVFRKFGYLAGEKDYEVTFKITSGNIAWININRIEIIK